MTGEAELLCVPCNSHDTAHKECFHLTAQGSKDFKEPKEQSVKEETFSVVLIGSATASVVFLVALLLWAFLLTAERFKQIPELCPVPEALLSVGDLQYEPLCRTTETEARQSEASSEELLPDKDPPRGLNSLSHENELPPTSIVINVTTNIKPSSKKEENVSQQGQQSRCDTKEEKYQMEQQLQKIWEVAQGYRSPQRLPGPFSVPAHLHVHTAAPAGPGCCSPA
ncbi:uncharacterized protein LOC117817699 [Notolabrus celidotus]|uniref:uncharacterized protein LOC117817699 n=1 Tax=Notolabrus celidotus TaxID=1203425 RepID=UPI0014903A9F|nr:uncharacterized protein LOC117817699 [Notolabrus celidotus]